MLSIDGRKIHFVGIGGIGMSAIAQLAADRGASVDGCDIRTGGAVRKLIARGYSCSTGHSPGHLDGVDVLVYSAAVPRDCEELVEARHRGLTVLSRSHMLAYLMQDHKSISVLGSHGKTTTTWLISHLLIDNGLDPTVMLGGNVASMDGNFRRGRTEWFVSEIDESDGLPEGIASFCTILTNIDKEHMREYGSVENMKQVFLRFLNDTSSDGSVLVCADDENAMSIAGHCTASVITYGLSDHSDIAAVNVQFDSSGGSFDILLMGKIVEGFTIPYPGNHNVCNCLAAIGAAHVGGVPVDGIRKSLAGCGRVERRLNVRQAGNVTVVDDYGHHPTEVKATLDTIRQCYEGQILCVFQPHRFTRTADLMEEFGTCFGDADRLCVLPIYPANESPIEGVTAEAVADQVSRSSSVAVSCIGREDVRAEVEGGAFSVVVLLGAGDIVEIADELVERP